MKLIFALLFIFFSVSEVFAFTKEEQRTWLGIFARKEITSELDFWAETQLRHDETHQTMNQTLNRFGV
jgi:hypothetical protein